MKTTKIPGKLGKHKILLYAISTCVWCKRTKAFLNDHDLEYEYVDVDTRSNEERDEIRNDIVVRGGRLSYPVIIIDDKILINGYHEDRMRKILEI